MSDQTHKEFWAGDFGHAYQQRNRGLWPRNISLFAEIFSHMPRPPNQVLELGCGEGQNLHAIQLLSPRTDLWGFEINESAAERARETVRPATVVTGDALTLRLPCEGQADLVLTKGFLIHVPPDRYPEAVEAIWAQSMRWILLCEYYNPALVEVPYRGHAGRLWKNDWPSLFRDRGPHELRAYGFRYRGDLVAPQDDLTWFLIEKG